MPKKYSCKTCAHKKVGEITQKLRSGGSLNSISNLYGISRSALKRHKEDCMSKLLATDTKMKDALSGDALIDMVRSHIDIVQKMLNACDVYLTDPHNPEVYFLGAQAHEIEVVYNEIDEEGKILPTKEKAMLQDLLAEVEVKGQFIIKGYNTKHADPRDLLLKSATKLENTAKFIMESSRKLLEFEQVKKALAEAEKSGGSVTIQEQVSSITKSVTIALKGSNTEELSKLAGLPEIN
jgi:hypothetical protein